MVKKKRSSIIIKHPSGGESHYTFIPYSKVKLRILEGWIEPIFFEVPEEFHIKITKDGNKVCALIGINLQVGVSGFGETLIEALRDLVKNLNKFGEES